ncbi:MAG: peroxiredoxin family protein [Tannerellaceae bacterium]|nr:peroxiredoxin family protein [Tannerellaceae bacterium]
MKEKRKVVLLAGFVLYSFYLIAQEEMGKVEVGQGIPEFSVIDEYGNKLTIGPYLEKVILIHFFNLWNENTSRELEEIKNDIWEKYKDYTNFALMVIGVENRDDELSAYKKKEDIPFYLYSDPVGEIYAHFALGETLPHT